MTEPLIIGAGERDAGVACVLIHGRGQTPEDMAEIAAAAGVDACRFVLPRAAGKSWYSAKAVDPMTDLTEDQLAASLAQVGAAVALARAGGRRVLLAGFSQGACMAAEYTARVGRPDGLCLFTGCRVGRAEGAMPDLTGLPVYASCGDADPWIPLADFTLAAGDFARAGARVRTDVFPGRGHEVSATEVAMLAGMLADLAAGRTPLEAGR